MFPGDRIDIRVSLAADSLPLLLRGEWAARVWLEPDGDDGYRLFACVAGSETTEAMLRLVYEAPTVGGDQVDGPPVPDPSINVEEQMERLRARLGWDAE